MKEREQFKSRIGFILLSAGCAIGIGNVWRFPYVVGENGGGIFVLFYLIFLTPSSAFLLLKSFPQDRFRFQEQVRSEEVCGKSP